MKKQKIVKWSDWDEKTRIVLDSHLNSKLGISGPNIFDCASKGKIKIFFSPQGDVIGTNQINEETISVGSVAISNNSNHFGCYDMEISNNILVVLPYTGSLRKLTLEKNSAVINHRGLGFENLTDETVEMDLSGEVFY